MSCHTGYIELDNITTSRSGLYADSLPGIDIELIDGLRKNAKDSDQMWALLYNRAWTNLVADVSKNLQDKFFVDGKLVSRETSVFNDSFPSGISGVKIDFTRSRYSKIHVISVSLWSLLAYAAIPINFYDTDQDGEVLLTKTQALIAGRNTINVDTDFDVDTLFIGVTASVKGTDNKYYQGMRWENSIVCFECFGGQGSVQQINGGGINAKYNIFCSIDKFVCENINLFKYAFWWKIGVELVEERRFGERLNRFTTMTVERATELDEYYNKRYEIELMNVIKSQNIQEDTICFNCKNTVYTATSLP